MGQIERWDELSRLQKAGDELVPLSRHSGLSSYPFGGNGPWRPAGQNGSGALQGLGNFLIKAGSDAKISVEPDIELELDKLVGDDPNSFPLVPLIADEYVDHSCLRAKTGLPSIT